MDSRTLPVHDVYETDPQSDATSNVEMTFVVDDDKHWDLAMAVTTIVSL